MPTPRSLIVRTAFSGGGDSERQVFHCVSRVVDRNFVFGEDEREEFSRMMRAAEAFSGVRVLAWTILSNHFHLLLEVPEKPAGFDLEEGEFWRRMEALYSGEELETIRGTMRSLLTTPGGAAGEAMARDYRRRFLDRMLDLSEFMKTLKQRFTIRFNRSHERVGTLWESRFKAVLVEGNPETLMKVAAYIDLNAVRAGIVVDPKDYRWCGYAEALGARKKVARERARGALAAVMGEEEGKGQGSAGDRDGKANGRGAGNEATGRGPAEARREWKRVQGEYRKLLYGAGDETVSGKGGFTQGEVEKIVGEGGKLTVAELLRCRVRHFTEGLVLGSKAFVNGYFEEAKAAFGARRKSGARKLRACGEAALFAIRELG